MKAGLSIGIADRFHIEARAWLIEQLRLQQQLGPSRLIDIKSDADLAECDALILRSRYALTRERIGLAPKLRAAVTATAGFEHMDLSAAAARGLRLAYTPDAHTAPAAELTWGLVLAATRKLQPAWRAQSEARWASRNEMLGENLSGRIYGVVGLGRIGRYVGRLAQAFGMKLVAYDPYVDEAIFRQSGAERLSLEELVHSADVISLHVPMSDETRRLVHGNHLQYFREGQILINTSRGEVLAEDDLLEHLKSGGAGVFGLDVFAREPLPADSPLWSHPKVLCTPHVGALTETAFREASLQAASSVLQLLNGQDAPHMLPPTAEWYTSRFANVN